MTTVIYLVFLLLVLASGPETEGASTDGEASASSDNSAAWDRLPVIGVLTQHINHFRSPHGDTFILSQYIKWVQAGGAHAIPIRVNQPDSYYEELLSKINGVLIPGGGQNLNDSGYALAAKKIWQIALQYNDAGNYFPLWGTCLGFEMMCAIRTYGLYNSLRYGTLARCDAMEYMIPLNFTDASRTSRLFKSMSPSMKELMSKKNITANQHIHCIPKQFFDTTPELNQFFDVTSTNMDRNGDEFISTMEAKTYPFYASMWHVERNMYGMGSHHKEMFNLESVRVGQYFTNFFVDEARKSDHRFSSTAELDPLLIDNYRSYRPRQSKRYMRYSRYLRYFIKTDTAFEPQRQKQSGAQAVHAPSSFAAILTLIVCVFRVGANSF